MRQRLRPGVVLLFVGFACGLLARAQTPQKTPVVISIYAVHQGDSPVRIAQLHYTDHGIVATLVNDSDKTVTGVRTASHSFAPLGCGSAVGHPYFATLTQGLTEPLEIPPHGTADASVASQVLDLGTLTLDAKSWQASRMQFQFMVGEVVFADGSKWRSKNMSTVEPPDPTLVNVPSELCLGALPHKYEDKSHTFTFDASLPPSQHTSDEAVVAGELPHVVFTCYQDNESATCPVR
jgi:hypothetical protein